MSWSEGNIWVADIPFKTIQDSFGGAEQKFEFKFVIKRQDMHQNFELVKWESGSENHVFDGPTIQSHLGKSNVKQSIQSQLGKPGKEDKFLIGGFMVGSGDEVRLSDDGNDGLPKTAKKVQFGYSQKNQALIYQVFWQN